MNIYRLRIIAILFLILIFFFLSNCISTQNYFINRGNDLKDIAHIGVEKDVYGDNLNGMILNPLTIFNFTEF